MKKLMSVALATAMSAALCCAAFADGEKADGTAYLIINNEGWAPFATEEVAVTGNGSYSLTATSAEADGEFLAQFNCLQIEGGEELFNHSAIITIDSIEINGAAITLTADPYTTSRDGAGVSTIVNIYNEWNSPDALNEVNSKKGYADQRVANISGNEAGKIISEDYVQYGLDEKTGEYSHPGVTKVKTLKVNFTVSGIATETGDSTPIIYLAAIVGIAGIAMVASKKRA